MILNEFESKGKLQQFGINIPKGYFVKDFDSKVINHALNFINADKYVIKIVSDDIIHKSDSGGVILNVLPEDVAYESIKMINTISDKFPKAKINGIYLQEMCKPGIECIVGIKTDPNFGQVIVFGMGGIYAEVFHDISMVILPITKDDAHQMILETKIYKILSGARGKQYDVNAITDILIKVSQMAEALKIKELDINPLIVYEKGVIALDARIMI